MAGRGGGSRIKTNKVRSGPDQAFTLPKGTSAAPIKGPGMGVKPKAKPKTKPKETKYKKGSMKGFVNVNQTYKKEIAKLQKLIDKNNKKKK
tara:strand:- start:230 stop:502 length:273 start_codon:yes stop_codon:yes gene_type:complete